MMKYLSWLAVVLCLSVGGATAEAATLSITTAGPNTGNVSVHGLGMLCGFSAGTGTTCNFTIPDGTAIKLVANSPSTPGVFSGGSGDAVACATSVCFFTLTQNSAITATFAAGSFPSVTFLLAGDGTGEVGADNSRCQNFELGYSACTIYYAAGSQVRLEGRSLAGNLFTGFSAGTNDASLCTTTSPCDFTITTSSTVVASFAALTSVNVSPASATINVGGSQSFSASGTFSNGGTRGLQTGAGAWNSKLSMGAPRYGLAAAALGDYIYAVGGIHDTTVGPSSRLERYSLGSGAFNFDSWTTTLPGPTPLAPMPTPREGLEVAVLGGELYAFGGHTSGGAATATMEAYDPASNTWAGKAPLPVARTWPAAAVIGGRLYVAGGGEQAAPLDALDVYDPSSNTWTALARMPTPRTGLTAVAVNGILYAIGGFNGGNLAVVEAYDPAAGTWSTKAPMPTPRTLLEAGVLDGVVYAVGGTSGSGLGTVEAYNPATDLWTTMATMPQGRSESALAVKDGRIWIVGGLTSGSAFVSALHTFRPPELTWTSSDAAVATVSSFGMANGIGAGTATIAGRAAGLSCGTSGVCGTLTVGAPPPPPPPPPPPSGPVVYGGGEAHAVDSLLSYQGIGGIISLLPSGTTQLPLTIRYGATIKPNRLKVYFDGDAVGQHFNPAQGSTELIQIPLSRGLHVLYLEIDGTVNGRTKTDRDLLLFLVR